MRILFSVFLALFFFLVAPDRCYGAEASFDPDELYITDSMLSVECKFRAPGYLRMAYDYGYNLVSGDPLTDILLPSYMEVKNLVLKFDYSQFRETEADYILSFDFVFRKTVGAESEYQHCYKAFNISHLDDGAIGDKSIFPTRRYSLELQDDVVVATFPYCYLHVLQGSDYDYVLDHVGIRLLNSSSLSYGYTVQYDFTYKSRMYPNGNSYAFPVVTGWRYDPCVRIDFSVLDSASGEVFFTDYVESSFGVCSFEGLSRFLTDVVTPAEGFIDSIVLNVPKMLYEVVKGLLSIVSLFPNCIVTLLPFVPLPCAHAVMAVMYFIIVFRVYRAVKG